MHLWVRFLRFDRGVMVFMYGPCTLPAVAATRECMPLVGHKGCTAEALDPQLHKLWCQLHCGACVPRETSLASSPSDPCRCDQPANNVNLRSIRRPPPEQRPLDELSLKSEKWYLRCIDGSVEHQTSRIFLTISPYLSYGYKQLGNNQLVTVGSRQSARPRPCSSLNHHRR